MKKTAQHCSQIQSNKTMSQVVEESQGTSTSSTRSTIEGGTKARWCNDLTNTLKAEFQKLQKLEPTKGHTLHPLINNMEWRTRLFYKRFEPLGITKYRWNRNYIKVANSFKLELEIFGSHAYDRVESNSKTSKPKDKSTRMRSPLRSIPLNHNQQTIDPHYGILAKRKKGTRWCYTKKLKEEFQKVQKNDPNKEEELNLILEKGWKEKLFYNEFESLGVTKEQWNRNYQSAVRSFKQDMYKNEQFYQKPMGKMMETNDEDLSNKTNIIHTLSLACDLTGCTLPVQVDSVTCNTFGLNKLRRELYLIDDGEASPQKSLNSAIENSHRGAFTYIEMGTYPYYVKKHSMELVTQILSFFQSGHTCWDINPNCYVHVEDGTNTLEDEKQIFRDKLANQIQELTGVKTRVEEDSVGDPFITRDY